MQLVLRTVSKKQTRLEINPRLDYPAFEKPDPGVQINAKGRVIALVRTLSNRIPTFNRVVLASAL